MKKTAVLFYSGYTQDYSKLIGMEALQRIAEQEYKHRDDVEVYEHRRWNDDPKKTVRYLIADGVTDAISFHYSYGGGYAAPRLAKECAKQGIKVRFMGLCDPVSRPLWLPTWTWLAPLQARSLTPWAKVKIPSNVQCVEGVRQENNLPKAHPIKWRGHVWELPLSPRHDARHDNMDESPEWHDLVFNALHKHL